MFRSNSRQLIECLSKFERLQTSHNLISKTTQSSPSRDYSTNNRYKKEPPIDLKKVRTNHNQDEGDDPKKPSYGLVLLTLPLLTFGLGTWQIKRREWKLDLIKFLEKRTTVEPRELPKDPKELEELSELNEFYPYKIKGRFVHSKEILMTPKHDITGTNHLPGGLIITPFVVSGRDDGLTILVNRGYVPYTNYSPVTRADSQVLDEVEITGLLRQNEIISSFTPENKPPNEWHFREIDLMAKTLNTAPIFIDADMKSSMKGGPLGGQTQINLRNEHMSYIITWYTLTFFTTVLWFNKFGRQLFRKV